MVITFETSYYICYYKFHRMLTCRTNHGTGMNHASNSLQESTNQASERKCAYMALSALLCNQSVAVPLVDTTSR